MLHMKGLWWQFELFEISILQMKHVEYMSKYMWWHKHVNKNEIINDNVQCCSCCNTSVLTCGFLNGNKMVNLSLKNIVSLTEWKMYLYDQIQVKLLHSNYNSSKFYTLVCRLSTFVVLSRPQIRDSKQNVKFPFKDQTL